MAKGYAKEGMRRLRLSRVVFCGGDESIFKLNCGVEV